MEIKIWLVFSYKTYVFDSNSIKHCEIKISNRENKFDDGGEIISIHEHNSYNYIQLVLDANYLNYTGKQNIFFDLNKDFAKENVHIVVVEKLAKDVKRKRIIERAKINGYREQFSSNSSENEIMIEFKGIISTAYIKKK